ncbi:MAG TPA: V4R domain-containing protein [Nitrososphaera sp.]|nr:V4R domain-containing protein [Nitrososphaera sp.]
MRLPDDSGPHHRWQDYHKIKQEVIGILAKNPNGITGAKIAELVGITQGAMSKYLSMMNVDGIIVSRKVGVAKLWKLVSSSDRTDLLADKLSSQNVNFKDYALSLVEKNDKLLDPDNKRVLVIHSALLVNLYRYTKTILGSEAHAFFYEWGKSFTREVKDLVATVAERTETNFISSFLSFLKLQGWGRFEIKSAGSNSIEVVWHDSFWAEEPDNTPSDDFIVGALTEAASLTFGVNWRFIEAECRSTGAKACRFVGSRLE